MQRITQIWTIVMTRLTRRADHDTADPLDADVHQREQALKVRWWYWRHHYLEAKRRQVALRQDDTRKEHTDHATI